MFFAEFWLTLLPGPQNVSHCGDGEVSGKTKNKTKQKNTATQKPHTSIQPGCCFWNVIKRIQSLGITSRSDKHKSFMTFTTLKYDLENTPWLYNSSNALWKINSRQVFYVAVQNFVLSRWLICYIEASLCILSSTSFVSCIGKFMKIKQF